MELTLEDLCRDEWCLPGSREIRMRFRKDGSGYYDRKVPGKLIHEKLLFKLEDVLAIKFARAREWTHLAASVRPGRGQPGERIGQRELVLEDDPYAKAVEDQPSGELVLQSDAGACLPSQ
ncbi:MAG: hypothetical protein HY901_24820 [Deltaproteobacteria bacterium]|nr:hypothetical protein [Deltaproteobacteria bacterium]